MNKIILGKGLKGFLIGLVPILIVTLKQHGCEIDDWKLLLQDLSLALIPALGHAAWAYTFPSKNSYPHYHE